MVFQSMYLPKTQPKPANRTRYGLDRTGYGLCFSSHFLPGLLVIGWLAIISSTSSIAQSLRMGSEIPTEVDAIYERGLAFLAKTQDPDTGGWRGRRENGVTGLCLMAFLASGEDPNFGRYRRNIRLAIRALINGQEKNTGYFPNSMYHHGFALLSLAEAYGAVDEETLWDGRDKTVEPISIAQAIQKGIRLALQSQSKNTWGAWRYSPTSTDADTSVTGSVLMGLLACKNAGFDVPAEALEKAMAYMKRNTAVSNGYVAYSGGLRGGRESVNRSAVATLVFAVGQKRDWEEYTAVTEHIVSQLDHKETSHRHYYIYYMAQALFQSDVEAWQQWNRSMSRLLSDEQSAEGSYTGSHGDAYGTAMSLLALALNYRFLPIYERF